MNTKSNGNPMKALLRRLEASGVFELIVFGDEMILNQPIEEWPKVECLIAFYSGGFPLEKAIEYVKLVKPIEINRLDKQRLLRDRLAMYETLRTYEIPCPDYMFVDHLKSGQIFEETDDYIIFNQRKLAKPFVEKPIDGDDHNIWIYYPPSVGGGCKKLIRKTDDKSSEFDPNCNKVRRDGAYLYEPFLPTQGLDVKVYMVGTGYSHAEARKAPTVDGRVMRSKDGKEIRYPIALSEFEKVCGALVVKAFSQYFCGFDVLRTKGGSVICDVNGWSFVKGNQRYYDDAALLLQRFFLDKINVKFPILPSSSSSSLPQEETELHNTYNEHKELEEEQLDQSSLRSVIVIMRHGDRRPKEKLKFKTSNPDLLAYFAGKSASSEILIKHPEDMEKLSATVRKVISELVFSSEEFGKFDALRMVLELHESFEGVTRKVQLKPIEFHTENGLPKKLLVVAKWGGELTDMGRLQAEDLGRYLRMTLFPVSSSDAADDSLLRLHSSFRHDFKIYSSIEGRCQTTAAAFTKGFLDLEGDLTPILVSLVCYDDFARDLLDEPIPKEDRDKVKRRIDELLHSKINSKSELIPLMIPTEEEENKNSGLFSAVSALLKEGNPHECLVKVHAACTKFINQLVGEIKNISEQHPMVLDAQLTVNPQTTAYQRPRTVSGSSSTQSEAPFTGPGPRLQQRVEDMVVLRWVQLRRIEHRWTKLIYGFGKGKTDGSFDTSKVTDLWDCAYYDIVHHNQELPQEALLTLERDLMGVLVPLHAWVSASEFGITARDKLRIGVETTWRLLQKIVNDVEFMLREGDDNRRNAIMGTPPADGGLSSNTSPSFASIVNMQEEGKRYMRSVSNSFSTLPQVEPGSGVTTPSSNNAVIKSAKQSKVPPELRALLRQAMRDGSDWHPQLHETVAQITGMKTSKCVRTRVYVTSASTMHSLLNVLAFGQEASDEDPIDRSKFSQVTDLHYLSHFVIRCFEEPSAADPFVSKRILARTISETVNAASPVGSVNSNGKRYTVEVLFSPGVECEDDSPEKLRESRMCLIPLQSICRESVCSLDDFDAYLTEILVECGKLDPAACSDACTANLSVQSPRLVMQHSDLVD